MWQGIKNISDYNNAKTPPPSLTPLSWTSLAPFSPAFEKYSTQAENTLLAPS